MKTKSLFCRLVPIVIMLCIQIIGFSQIPQGISYQAVIRDGSGNPIMNKTIGIRISLEKASGMDYYSETQSTTTNATGVISITIGEGTMVGGGAFNSIPWSNGDVFIKIEVDPSGGTSYTPIGSPTKLMSVPYALYAASGLQGPAGTNGISIQWLGNFPAAPTAPALNQAYYNTIDKKSYIWNGSAWSVITQDGAPGTSLVNRGNWVSGTAYVSGNYVFDRSSTNEAITSMWICQEAITSSNQPYMDSEHWVEFQTPAGPQGVQGESGDPGSNGISIQWLASQPAVPSLNQAYYSTADRKFYIWNGSAWSMISQDGVQGAQGIQGLPGTGLTNKGNWATNTVYSSGDYVFDRSSTNPAINSMWICQTNFTSIDHPYADLTNWSEFQAPAGPKGEQGLQGDPGTPGSNGISIQWLGTYPSAPSSPSLNQAYYNSTDKKSYVYSGPTNGWQTISQDGMPITGASGQMLYHNGTTWAASSVLINSGTNIGVSTTPTQKLDVNGNLRVRGNIYDYSNSPGLANQLLAKGPSGVLWQSLPTVGIPSGVGSAGQVALWSGANTLQGLSNISWASSLQVSSNTTALPDDPIFEVRNKDGKVVFGVYQGSVRVYVDDTAVKGTKGGFAVGGLSGVSKGGVEYLSITPDSARIFVNEVPTSKGTKGGFAVGGLSGVSKATARNLMYVGIDSTRIYIDSASTVKGTKGGFAVGGLSGVSKGSSYDLLKVTADSTRIYVDDKTTKGTKGGFAVGGLSGQSKGENANFFSIETGEKYIINPSQARILWYPLKNAFLVGEVLIENPNNVGLNSFASGYKSKAKGEYSQALGYQAAALGNYSTAIGKNTSASSNSSFAFGDEAVAASEFSYAFGKSSHANGLNSFAFGESVIAGTSASITNAYAFGKKSEARGSNSYALGDSAIAEGTNSFALGSKSLGFGTSAYALGKEADAHGNSSYAFGEYATATGIGSYAFGSSARDSEGNILPDFKTKAEGNYSFAFGLGSKATQMFSFAIGTLSEATNTGDFAIGMQNIASGGYSLSIGLQNTSSGQTTVSIGHKNTFSGTSSVSIGNWNESSNGGLSFGAFNESKASGSIAIGFDNTASGLRSISLGEHAISTGHAAIATGLNNTSSGDYSFSSGYRSNAIGTSSFSANYYTKTTGYHSAAFGNNTVARAFASLVVGQYNDTTGIASTSISAQTDPLFVVGNGWEEAHRSNAFSVLNNGNVGVGTSTPQYLLEVNGAVGIGTATAQGSLQLKGNGGILNLAGDDHCYIQFYPDTYGAGRKGYFGYPGPDNNDIHLTNLIAGGNIGLNPGTSGTVNIGITGAALKVNNTEALWYNNDYFSWGYGGNSNFFDDFVGLGKTYPTERLELGGTNAKIFLNSTTSI